MCEINPEYKKILHRYRYVVKLKQEMKYDEALVYCLALNMVWPRAELLLDIGYCYENLGDNVNAELYYVQAIEMKEPLKKLSTFNGCYAKFLRDVMGDYQKADIYYSKAVNCNDAGCHIYYQCGLMLQYNMGRYKAALDQYLNALKFDSNSAECMIQAAICYEVLNDYENANEFYVKAIGNCEEYREEVKYLNWYGMFLRDDVGKYEEAKGCFIKAIEIDSRDENAYYQYGRLLRDYIGDYSEAAKYYLKCIEINPNRYGVHGSYGYLLYLMKDYEMALKYVKVEINDISYDNIWAHFYCSVIHKAMNNDKAADVSLWRAVGLAEVKDTEDFLNYLRILSTISECNAGYQEIEEKFKRIINDKTKLSERNSSCIII